MQEKECIDPLNLNLKRTLANPPTLYKKYGLHRAIGDGDSNMGGIGTGKFLMARYTHMDSSQRFLPVDLARQLRPHL